MRYLFTGRSAHAAGLLACILSLLLCILPSVVQAQQKAPELRGIEHWINSEPLQMRALEGQVVLVDFWDYSCINCLRTFPYLKHWYETYHDQGFTIIGVHSPEFEFGKDIENIEKAVRDFDLPYPIAMDNRMATWNAWSNRYWPAEYLVNKNGQVIWHHFGEGEYLAMENAIRHELGLEPIDSLIDVDDPDFDQIGSPEMYFGVWRMRNLANPTGNPVQLHRYTLPDDVALNQFALGGAWQMAAEYAELKQDDGVIAVTFNAAKLHMVAESDEPLTVTVEIDGEPTQSITVDGSQLYTLFDGEDYAEHTVRLRIPQQGFRIYTFTFG